MIQPTGYSEDTSNLHCIERAEVTADEVQELPFDLSVLTEEGIVVDVDALGTGLFDTTLDLSDLGVVWEHTERRTPLRPVKCALVPSEIRNQLIRPTSRGHDILDKYSFRFLVVEVLTHTASNRWVPWRAWREFKAKLDATRAELERAKEAYENSYPSVCEQMRETFSLMASDTARRLRATSSSVHLPEDFETSFVERMVERIPYPEEVREKLILSFRVRPLRLGSEMLAEQRQASEERMKLKAFEAEERIRREEEAAKQRELQQHLWADEEALRRRLDAERTELEREAQVKEELRQLRVSAAREQLAGTLDPFQEGAEQLHAAVHEAAVAVRDALRDGRLESAKAMEMGRMYKLLNFTSDSELDALVSEMERLTRDAARAGKRKRADAPLDRVLGDIIRNTYQGAKAATERSRADTISL